MFVDRANRAALGVTVAVVLVAGCVGDGGGGGEVSPTTAGEGSSSSSSSSPDFDAAALATFEAELRARLVPLALPAFTIPLDVFRDAADRSVESALELSPGLYQGIAVLDARCDEAGRGAGADAEEFAGGSVDTDGGGTYQDELVRITVDGDGSGTYADRVRRITIDSDGSGTYDELGTGTTVSIDSDGSGSADVGGTSYVVESDGTGTYDDGQLRVRVDGPGSGTYDDGTTRVRIEGGDVVDVEGDEAPVPAITDVLADGLSLFPPVPRVGPVPSPVTGRSCGTVVRLDAAVLFDFDGATLRPDGVELLDRVAALLSALGYPDIDVNGHTDGVGEPAYNDDLSRQRAAAVAAALEAAGVPASSLTTFGLGESLPLVPEVTPDGADDPAARQRNRRVELVLPEPEPAA